jgi:hypothetical protein
MVIFTTSDPLTFTFSHRKNTEHLVEVVVMDVEVRVLVLARLSERKNSGIYNQKYGNICGIYGNMSKYGFWGI